MAITKITTDALDASVATTILDSPAITGNLTTNALIDGRNIDTDGTKLDTIESSATADQTDAEIRTAVEAATDSNVFTDADHTKLNAVEASADVTDTTNVVAALSAGTGVAISGAGVVSVTAVALTTVQTAANQSAQLALTAQEGDIVVRSDENKTYCHNGGSAGAMSDYTLLATPTDAVLSVNSQTGAVSADHIATAVEAATDSNTFTDADHTKLNAIEASADVTDATNVTAAGALMTTGGTVNGLTKFDQYGSSAGHGRIEFGNSGEPYIQGIDTGNGGSGAYLKFGINTTDVIYIKNDFNVGIGTTNPGVELDIKRRANGTPLRIGSDQGEGRAIVFADVHSSPTKYNWIAGAQTTINNGFEITPSTAVGGYTFSNPAITVLHTGEVGIGVTDPDTQLEVNIGAGADGNGIHITSTATGNDPTLRISRNGGADDYKLTVRGGAGTGYLSISNGTSLTTGINLTSSNTVVVGTTASGGPAKMTVWSASATGTQAALRLNNPGGFDAQHSGPSIEFAQDRSTTENYKMASIQSKQTFAGSSTSGGLGFSVRNSNSFSEVMTLDSLGRLGIGTTAPPTKLANTSTRIANADGLTVSTSGLNWALDAQGYVAALSNLATSDNHIGGLLVEIGATGSTNKILDLESGGVNRVRVLGSGNVGIGTTTPDKLLEVQGTDVLARFTGTDANPPHLEFKNSTGMQATIGLNTTHDFIIDTAGEDVYIGANALTAGSAGLFIKADGKVGIGTTSPSNLLSFKGPGNNWSTSPAMKLWDSQYNVGWYVGTANNDVAGDYYIRSVTSESAYPAVANQQFTIKQDGKVGIGTITPASLLDVGGGLVADPTIRIDSAAGGDPTLIFDTGAANRTGLIRFLDQGNTGGGFIKYEHNGDKLDIGSGSANSVMLSVRDGNIGFYGPTWGTWAETVVTRDGGSQSVRFVQDHTGLWIVVGRFASNAQSSVKTTWSSVRGLSTSTAQDATTEFSADWGGSYATECRFMGATDFTDYYNTRTIDFVHVIPNGVQWKHFMANGTSASTSDTTTMNGTVTGAAGGAKYGWTCAGAYDGFGRWNNPNYKYHKISDTGAALTHYTDAFAAPRSGAFYWNAQQDAKITVNGTGLDYSGQDVTETSGFGNDDSINGFFDEWPTAISNMGANAQQDHSSAVWVLIKMR